MDYAAVATMIINALSPFAVKGIEKIVEKSAEEGFNQRRAIFEQVKALFSYDEPILLNLLQDATSDPEKKGELRGELKAHLQSHPDIAQQLHELLKGISLQSSKTENYRVLVKDTEGVGIIAGKIDAQELIGQQFVFPPHSKRNEPRIDLALREPTEIAIPPFLPLSDELVVNIALREAAERRLPALSWVAEQLEKSDEEENDDQERSLVEQFLHGQRIQRQYCYELYEWYRNTMRSALTTFENRQLSARIFYLYFEIRNSGKSPAERIDVELEFPEGIDVNKREGTVYPVFSPPSPSADTSTNENCEIPLAVCPNIDFPEWSLHLGRRYSDELKNTNYKSICDSEYISIRRSENSRHFIGVCRLRNLDHGKIRKINPVKILFTKEAQPTSLLLKYKTHASNQPVDILGEIEIPVRT